MIHRFTTIVCLVLCLTVAAFAQESMGKNNDTMGKKDEMHSMNNGTSKKGMMNNRLIMKDGKMMAVRNGKTMPMKKAMMMPNGSTIKPNGEVITKDGKSMMLKNGTAVGMNGTIIKKSTKMKKMEGMTKSMKKDEMNDHDTKKDGMMKKNQM